MSVAQADLNAPARAVAVRRDRRPTRDADTAPDCLVAKFSRHKELTKAELSFLKSLQEEETTFAAGREIIVQGEPSPNLFVLKSGWAYSHKLLANGKRQVLEVLLPGDLLGMREFAFDGALNYVTTLTMTTVCPFPRARLHDFYKLHPGLTGVLCDILMREQAVLIERVADVGSRSAYQRVSHLILELYFRVGQIGLRQGNSFDFQINQTLLGETLGLSRVHVARTLRELRQNRLLKMDRRSVTVLDEQGLIRAAGFEEFYLAKL